MRIQIWDEDKEEWYFSVVDVVAVLTESPDYNTGRKYWNKLKQRLKDEGSQLVTSCHQLKLKSQKDGKRYMTDVANTEQLLRIIQSIPSKKAEPFKLWLAQIAGHARTEIEEKTGKSVITSENAQTMLLGSAVTGMIEGIVKSEEDN